MIILQTNYLKMAVMVTKMNMPPNGTLLSYSYGSSMRMALGSFLAEYQSLCAVKTGKVLFFVTFDHLL